MIITKNRLAATLLLLAIATTALPPTAAAADPLAPQPAFDPNAFDGRVARSSDGRHVVVWEHGGTVLAQRYGANATPLGSPIHVTASDGTKPRAAMDALGRFVVVWQSGDGTEVRARRFSAEGVAEGGELPVSGPQAHILDAAVDLDPRGGFVVVWDQFERLETGKGMSCVTGLGDCLYLRHNAILARRYAADGTPASEVRTVDGRRLLSVSVGQAALGAGPLASGPDVTVRADGSYVVAWSRVAVGRPGTISGIYTQTVGANDVARPAQLVKFLNDGYPAFSVSIDSDAAGNYVVAYSQQVSRAPTVGVIAERFSARGRPLGTRRVDDGAQPVATAPDVWAQPSGGFVVLWQSGPAAVAAPSTAWSARRFDGDGRAIAGSFSMLSATASGQVAQLSGDGTGRVAIDWKTPWQNHGAPARVVAAP